ncbi:hypothetical protein PR048_019376 [Dryococelus australis]|uniref:Uncharacterized protein n=1 Tax=Dryococelus australis TaxID=614101 RepID=A0ABQ9H3B3_9NEOP|nr:hypothetical protein PR048_019376 [Dryococelus australis]
MRMKRGVNGAALECKDRRKREIHEKTCRPAASSGMIPTCRFPPPGIEPGSPSPKKLQKINKFKMASNTLSYKLYCEDITRFRNTVLDYSNTRLKQPCLADLMAFQHAGVEVELQYLYYYYRMLIATCWRLFQAVPSLISAGKKERAEGGKEGKGGYPRENPPTSGIVRHDSLMRKSGRGPAGDRTRFDLVGGEQRSSKKRSDFTSTPVRVPANNKHLVHHVTLSKTNILRKKLQLEVEKSRKATLNFTSTLVRKTGGLMNCNGIISRVMIPSRSCLQLYFSNEERPSQRLQSTHGHGFESLLAYTVAHPILAVVSQNYVTSNAGLRRQAVNYSDLDPRRGRRASTTASEKTLEDLFRNKFSWWNEVGMEQRPNARAGETGYPRESPTTSGFLRHDSHVRKYAGGNQARFALVSADMSPDQAHCRRGYADSFRKCFRHGRRRQSMTRTGSFSRQRERGAWGVGRGAWSVGRRRLLAVTVPGPEVTPPLTALPRGVCNGGGRGGAPPVSTDFPVFYLLVVQFLSYQVGSMQFGIDYREFPYCLAFRDIRGSSPRDRNVLEVDLQQGFRNDIPPPHANKALLSLKNYTKATTHNTRTHSVK